MTKAEIPKAEKKKQAYLALIFLLAALGFQALFEGLTAWIFANNPLMNALAHIVDGLAFIGVAAAWLILWIRQP
jgi:hypothetical protein